MCRIYIWESELVRDKEYNSFPFPLTISVRVTKCNVVENMDLSYRYVCALIYIHASRVV